jgi:hypothetical protein
MVERSLRWLEEHWQDEAPSGEPLQVQVVEEIGVPVAHARLAGDWALSRKIDLDEEAVGHSVGLVASDVRILVALDSDRLGPLWGEMALSTTMSGDLGLRRIWSTRPTIRSL